MKFVGSRIITTSIGIYLDLIMAEAKSFAIPQKLSTPQSFELIFYQTLDSMIHDRKYQLDPDQLMYHGFSISIIRLSCFANWRKIVVLLYRSLLKILSVLNAVLDIYRAKSKMHFIVSVSHSLTR